MSSLCPLGRLVLYNRHESAIQVCHEPLHIEAKEVYHEWALKPATVNVIQKQ